MDGSPDFSSDQTPPPPVEVPRERLDPETLRQIVEEFVLREGTDYGAQEIHHQTKVEQVLKQLEKGDVKIFFDPESESVTLAKK
jgi:uncharacterized protein YheU (UPF0270 family)